MKRLLLLTTGFFFAITCLIAQGTVSGRVTDTNGEGLPGVTVTIKGTTTGTTTGLDGSYSLSTSDANSTLVFSYVGFETQEIAVGSRSTIDIVLREDATQLEEVVVTGSAVGKSRKTLSFSVGQIDKELLTEVPASTLGNGLQGKVAGLRVNNVSGQPGQGTFFQIRSANSIANGQQPLIIVDGVFLNGSTLADINSEDVERVEVLKGSAAASLYGSQAANGVIQIFTKRGKGVGLGETQVTYRGEFGFAEEVNRYDINNFTERVVGEDGTLGAPSANGIHDTPLPNLQDYQSQHLFRRGAFVSNFLGIQGRSETTGFAFSAQRLNDEGIIQTTDGYQRNSFRLNVDHSLNDKTDIQVSTMYSTSEQDLLAPFSNGPSSFIATTLQLTPMFDLTTPNEEDGSPFDWDVDNTGLATTNPLYDRANSEQTVNRTRIMGNFKINRDIFDWLSVNYNVSLDRSTNEYEQFLRKGYLSTNIPGLFGVNGTVGTNVVNDAGTVTGTSNGGGIHRTRRVRNFITQRANIVVQKQFGDWNTAFRGSFLYEELKNDYNEGIGENLAVANIRSLDNAQTNVFVASNSEIVVANSFFLIADVDYQQKYIFSGLVRTEGSSLFGPDERWNNFYRASGAYRITEDFAIPGFQELKVRASIGTAGIRPTYEQRFETFTLQNGTAQKNTLGNEALKPALSTEIEVGFDAAFLNAFNFEFNYSKITTEDQILRVPLSGAAGFTGQWRNAGTIEANVFEAALNIDAGSLLKLNNVTWNVGVTFDRVRQEITKLNVPSYNTGPGLQQSTLFLIEEGVSFGTMVGEVFATSLDQLADQEGIDPNDYEVNAAGYVVRSADRGTPNEVPYKLVDAAGNNIVAKIGDINPDFRMGFNSTVGYKGFSLYTLFDWKKGGDVYNMTKHWLFRDRRHAEMSEHGIADSFYGSNGLYNVLVSNNHFAEDASYFMLREASLSYNFSKGMLSNFAGGFFNNVKVSVIGRNLFTLTNYTGFHPDVTATPQGENTLSGRVANNPGSNANTPNGDPSLFAVDSFAYPVTRTFTGSITLTF